MTATFCLTTPMDFMDRYGKPYRLRKCESCDRVSVNGRCQNFCHDCSDDCSDDCRWPHPVLRRRAEFAPD